MAQKTKVQFTYERNVMNTAEGEVLSAMLADIGHLAERGINGATFRKLYGTGDEVNVEKFRQAAAANKLVSGRTFLIAPRKTNYEIDSRIRTPEVVAQEMKDAYERTGDRIYIDPVTGKPWDAERVDRMAEYQDAKRLEDRVDGDLGSNWFLIKDAYRKLYGEDPQSFSEADLQDYERLARLAASLGVTIGDVDAAALPRFKTGGNGGTKFDLNVFYESEIDGPKPSAFAGNLDRMRVVAHRPGGQNYENRMAEALRRGGSEAQFVDPFTGRAFRGNSVNRGVGEGLARSVNLYGGDESASPLAHVHKKQAYAVLRIFKGYAPDSPDPFNAPKRDGHPSFEVLFQTNRFLLEGVQESDMERMALIETFGDPYIYLFGSRARVWSYSGTLLDTMGLNWLNEWRVAYQRYMKGSKSTKLRARAVLCYDDVVREGVIVSSGISKSVAVPGVAQLSFQMFVIREHFIDGEPKSLEPLTRGRAEDTFFFSSADKQKNVEEQYDILPMTDATAARRTIPPSDRMLNAAVAVEDGIAEAKKEEIEKGIKGAAFEGGSLVRPAGSIVLALSDSDKVVIKRAAQAFTDKAAKLKAIPAARRGSSIPDFQLPVSAEI